MASVAVPAGWGAVNAAGAGLMGALAACCAKLALGVDYLHGGCLAVLGGGEEAATGLCAWKASLEPLERSGLIPNKEEKPIKKKSLLFHHFLNSLPMMLRVGCGGLVLGCNAVMWTLFAKALRYSTSSATATVISTASNFVSSAFLGNLLFGETHALLWWIGISVMLCGLALLHTVPPPSAEHRHPKDKKQ